MFTGEEQLNAWQEEQSGYVHPTYVPPKNPPLSAGSGQGAIAPGQAESSSRGVVGRGPPAVPFSTKSEHFLFYL